MDIDSAVRTRRTLHAVAEAVLAGPQYRASGTIRLRTYPGGFATTAEPFLQVVGDELMAPGRRLPLRDTTWSALADAVGVTAGPPDGLYSDGSGVGPDDPLDADPQAAQWIAHCFGIADTALRRVGGDREPVLWPEHFDIGVTVDEVNYGVSAGDGYQPEPYAYVGPHTPRTGPFWNAPFGAARPGRDLGGADAITRFFEEGRRLAADG
ncbi:hypothetical protein [Kitasatospora sp. NPDC059571]|uniref:hypothetical protein n=1 Tax=Kitasatospora sp. NPDC059571 TaxID=3346871 RepID=UPI0036926852